MSYIKQAFAWFCAALFLAWFALLLFAAKYQITPALTYELNSEQVALVEKLKADYLKVSTFTADDGRIIYCAGTSECSAKPPSWINENSGEIQLIERDQWEVAQLANTKTFWGATIKVGEYNSLRNALVAGMLFSGIFFIAALLPPSDIAPYKILRWVILTPIAAVTFGANCSGLVSFGIFVASFIFGPVLFGLALWGFNIPPTYLEGVKEGPFDIPGG